MVPEFQNLPLLLLKLGAIALALRFVIVYTHRYFFNEFSNIPGPFVAKFSDWYGAYHSAKGQLHVRTYEGHQRYGSAYRQGPNKVVFNTVTALQNIYHNKNVQKSKGYRSMVPAPGVYNIHTAIDKSLHRFKRRVVGQGLADSCMREFEPSLLIHVNKFVRNILHSTNPLNDSPRTTPWSAPINMSHQCKYLGYDIMGEFGFGQSFRMLDAPENRFLIDAVTAASHRSGIYGQFADLEKAKLDKLLMPFTMKLRTKFINLATRLVSERLQAEAQGCAKKDLFSFLIHAKDSETGRGFTHTELWTESRFLLIAGADTSSTALAALFFYLTRYPDCYQRVAEEVRSSFDSIEDVTSSLNPKMQACIYLRACVDEALRMSPPAGGTLWREVMPGSGGIVVDGIYIPEGCDVGCGVYCLHHNEDYYPDSFTFRPERWIVSPDNPREKVELAREAFNPFSLGSRGCAGKTMAYMELCNAMAKVLWLFDFEAAEGDLGRIGCGSPDGPKGRKREKEFQLQDHLTSGHDGPYVRFRRREGVDIPAY